MEQCCKLSPISTRTHFDAGHWNPPVVGRVIRCYKVWPEMHFYYSLSTFLDWASDWQPKREDEVAIDRYWLCFLHHFKSYWITDIVEGLLRIHCKKVKGQWVHKIGHTCTLMWFNDWFTNSAAKLLNKSFYFVKMTCQRILLCYKKGGTTKKLVTMMIRWKKIKVNLSMNRGTIMTRHNNNNPDKELNVDLTFLLTACC